MRNKIRRKQNENLGVIKISTINFMHNALLDMCPSVSIIIPKKLSHSLCDIDVNSIVF